MGKVWHLGRARCGGVGRVRLTGDPVQSARNLLRCKLGHPSPGATFKPSLRGAFDFFVATNPVPTLFAACGDKVGLTIPGSVSSGAWPRSAAPASS